MDCPACGTKWMVVTSAFYYCAFCSHKVSRIYEAPIDPMDDLQCESCQ